MFTKIKDFIFKILYVLILIYLIVFIPVFWGYKPLVVMSGSMEPTLKVGGILYYHKIDLDKYDKNDILVYETKEHIISHRIVEKVDSSFITQGDVNNTVDDILVTENEILGKGTNWSIPYIGYYADFIYSHKYILFISVAIIVIDLLCDFYKEHKKKVKLANEKKE